MLLEYPYFRFILLINMLVTKEANSILIIVQAQSYQRVEEVKLITKREVTVAILECYKQNANVNKFY